MVRSGEGVTSLGSIPSKSWSMGEAAADCPPGESELGDVSEHQTRAKPRESDTGVR